MNFDQLKTILWLRWRLTRNQWTRSRGMGAVLTGLVAAAMAMLAVLSFAGGFLGGMFGLREAKPILVTGVWMGVTLAFLFLWLIGLVSELQRSESIDLQRLMHLPVGLGQIFVVNYLASHLTMSIALFVPGMVGLACGMAISRGASNLLLLPLSLGMVFMVSAWTYLLRGWLATLMANPRRRRTVLMAVTFTFILVSQVPNIYLNTLGRTKPRSTAAVSQTQRTPAQSREQQKLKTLMAVQKFVPPLWVPLGAGGLAEGTPLPALLGMLGCFGLGMAGLRRAYQGTLKFYYGETSKNAPGRIEPEQKAGGTSTAEQRESARFLELRIPAIPEQAAALALATFRSMLRAPEVKMAWGSSFLVTFIMGVSVLFRSQTKVSDEVKPFIATAAVVFPVFMLVQFFSNQFGFDRDGFRALVLSPAPRKLVLLGKNLACLPPVIGFGAVLLLFVSFWVRPPVAVVLATLLQLVALMMIACIVGNLLSIVAPYRIQPGSMKPTKMPGLAVLLMVLCHLLFPIALLPAFLPPLAELVWQRSGLPNLIPVNLVCSLLAAGIVGLLYWQSLAPLSRLLQRRETKILGIVTVEVE